MFLLCFGSSRIVVYYPWFCYYCNFVIYVLFGNFCAKGWVARFHLSGSVLSACIISVLFICVHLSLGVVCFERGGFCRLWSRIVVFMNFSCFQCRTVFLLLLLAYLLFGSCLIWLVGLLGFEYAGVKWVDLFS